MNPKLKDTLYIGIEHLPQVVAMSLGVSPTDMWRVEVLPNGKLSIRDFTLPLMESRDTMEMFKQDAPKWLVDAIDVLSICDKGEVIPKIGNKVSERVFYVIEKKVSL